MFYVMRWAGKIIFSRTFLGKRAVYASRNALICQLKLTGIFLLHKSTAQFIVNDGGLDPGGKILNQETLQETGKAE